MSSYTHITRERNAILAALKSAKRDEIKAFCQTHNIQGGLARTKAVLEAALADHCVAEHSGRVVNLGKCDRSAPCASAGRPLVPLKRSVTEPSSSLQTRKKVAAEPEPASRPPSSASNAPALHLQDLQIRLDELVRSAVTKDEVEAIVEAKMAEQKRELAVAFADLRSICQTTLTNAQTSFDSIQVWRDEVTESFASIQKWASDVEQRILKLHTPQSVALGTVTKDTPRLSVTLSTPAAKSTPLPLQTPATQAMPQPKRVRLSDASEYSLATIPEQPLSPDGHIMQESEPEGLAEVDLMQEADADEAVPARDAMAEAQISTHGVDDSELQAGSSIVEHSSSISMHQESIDNGARSVAPTPAATKTLFGTEWSAEDRFDDTNMIEETGSTASPAMVRSWIPIASTWLKRVD